MLTLDAAKTLQGSAGTATAVTYTITGMELVGTTETYKLLAQGQLPTSTGALYTVPASTSAFLKEILLANTTASSVTVSLYVNGTAAANQIGSIPIPANGEATLDQTGWKVYNSTGALVLSLPLSAAVPQLVSNITGVAGTSGLASDAGHTHQIAAATTAAAGSMSAADKNTVTNLWIDVTNFNVLPSNSAATNRTALLALFASAATGSTLYFPPGTYQFDQNMNVGAKYFNFRGVGIQLSGGTTILQLVTGTAGLLTLTNGNWYTNFENIVFATGTTQTSGAMVTCNDNVAINFKNCAFSALGGTMFNCIDYTGTGAAANSCVVDTVFMSGFTNFGINVASDGASLVHINSVISAQWGTATQRAAACMNVVNAGAVQIDNCDYIGAVNNLLLAPTVGKVVASVFCTNTYMDNSFGSCLKITGAGATVRCRFIAVSFTTSNAGTGFSSVEISTTVAAGAQGIDFENCSALNTFGTTGTTNGFLITGAADFSIIACRIAGWTNGINITPLTPNGTTKPIIEDNTIGPTGGYGANTVGILLAAGAVQYGNILIADNQLVGNTTPMTDSSTVAATTQKIISGNGGLAANSAPIVATPATFGAVETVVHQVSIPAAALLAGTTYRVRAHGIITGTVPTLLARLRIGTAGSTADVAVCATAAAGVATGAGWSVDGIITIRTIGAGGAALGNISMAATAPANTAQTATVAVNTTVANFLSLTLIGGGTTPVVTVVNAFVDVVKQ